MFSCYLGHTKPPVKEIKLILLKETPQNPPVRRVLKSRSDTAVFDTKPMTPNMISRFVDLLKPICLYLIRFEIQIKKPVFNQTFLSPPTTKGNGAIKYGHNSRARIVRCGRVLKKN